MASRLGIGVSVDDKALQSPPLGPQHDQPESPSSPRLEDPAHGILIHHERQPSFGQQSQSSTMDSHAHNGLYTPETATGVSLPQESVHLPVSPALSANVQLISNAHEKIPADQLPQTVRPGVPVRTASKIRFAPLPNPRRQRSLSTGRNIAITATMESDGTRTLQRHARMDPDHGSFFAEPSNSATGYPDEEAVDDDEFEEDDDGDDNEDKGKRSSWKTMGMGNWKSGSFSSHGYTKKLLKPLLSQTNAGSGNQSDTGLERSVSRESTKRPSADAILPGSQSLRKTFSTTSGFIGTSPFRSAAEHERKRTFFPASSSTSGPSGGGHGMDILTFGMGDRKAKQAHRASATPDFSSLSASLGRQADTEFAKAGATSPRPVKMLNGRVYGQKRQEAKTAVEPEFVEWGGMMGTAGGGLGSNSTTTDAPAKPASMGSAASADEEDDGSGMAWIRKRREQRDKERRASEAGLTVGKPNALAFPDTATHRVGSLPTSNELHRGWQNAGSSGHGFDHMPALNEDRVATPVQSEYQSLPPPIPVSGFEYPASGATGSSHELSEQGRMQAFDEQHEFDDPGHIVQAVQIPSHPEEAIRWRQSFQADESDDEAKQAVLPDEEEEEDEENDFESDDEEELALEEEKKRLVLHECHSPQCRLRFPSIDLRAAPPESRSSVDIETKQSDRTSFEAPNAIPYFRYANPNTFAQYLRFHLYSGNV